MPGPMHGIRILDLSIALTGPYAAALLGDQGADVIKVERPGLGDIGRWVGVSVNGISALHQTCNRGKRSIAVDFQIEEGLDIVRRLAAASDVVIQNFRPGVAERIGLGYETLAAGHADLVYVSLSGFGSVGPYAHKGAYDTVIQAYGGLATNQAGPRASEPEFLRQTAADKITAMYAVQAITAALFARERGAGGQHVERLDARFGRVVPVGGLGRQRGAARQRRVDGVELRAGHAADAFPRRLGGGHADLGRRLPRHVRRVRRRGPRRPARRPDRRAPQASRARVGADRRLLRAGGDDDDRRGDRPVGAAARAVRCRHRAGELHADPHVQAVGLLEESDHPVAGRLRQPRHPARFGGTPAALGGPAPTLGQHTDAILAELGLDAEIASLRARQIIA